MIDHLLLGAAWLLVSLPTSVLLGKCIAVGQAGETARHAADAAAQAVDGSAAAQATPAAAAPAVPTQRRPVAVRHLVR